MKILWIRCYYNSDFYRWGTDTEKSSLKPMLLVPNYTLPMLLLWLSADLLPLNISPSNPYSKLMPEPFFCSILNWLILLLKSLQGCLISYWIIMIINKKVFLAQTANIFSLVFYVQSPALNHFTCNILFKPSCHDMEHRVSHNLIQIYTPFHTSMGRHTSMPLYGLVPSFSDFLSLFSLGSSILQFFQS